ncbi:MAG TPA: dTMP kinase [Candidatus Polarisedimenticolaceae bacterium]|nr:dTMP kinase [Candidatus Polarisedimenticolaceae bacterium]
MTARGTVGASGPWITFEGVEGTGKSTQLERLGRRLVARGRSVVVTREPGGTGLGRRLRGVLLEPAEPPMDAFAELLLYTADRAQHLAEVVLPALDAGRVVLCDRYLDATLAYQGHARGLGFARVLELHRTPPLDARPQRTLLFDMDPAVALGRARRRNASAASGEREDRFERERIEFHRRVREGYLMLAEREPTRIRLIDAAGEAQEVERAVCRQLADIFPELGSGE